MHARGPVGHVGMEPHTCLSQSTCGWRLLQRVAFREFLPAGLPACPAGPHAAVQVSGPATSPGSQTAREGSHLKQPEVGGHGTWAGSTYTETIEPPCDS